MSEELLVNVTPQETRVALVENGVLQEVFIEREGRRGLVGNIYKGRVSRVLPGMEAAFIDLCLERTAFLHANDIHDRFRFDKSDSETGSASNIAELVKEGDEIAAQVIKEPIGSKGARLTTQLSIPSRFLVFVPDLETIGVSQKIEDEEERTRLKEIVQANLADGRSGGYIIRTAAEGATEPELISDLQFLDRLWQSVNRRLNSEPAGSIIYEDLSLEMRTMREVVGLNTGKILIDSRETYERIKEFVTTFIPRLVDRIEHYPGERPIFDLYSVEDEIQKGLEKKVLLKSGGYLVIDQTEAMTTIDVNTGAFVGQRTQEETIFKTNLEASQAIARQLRLRNLGGIIIIDFIDMAKDEHKQQVLKNFEAWLARDRSKTQITEVSALGLVEMTRKRTRESLEHVLCEPCPMCSGRASVKTAQTVCYEIFRELLREARQFDVKQYLVLASQVVVDTLLDEESTSVARLEEFIGKPIRFQIEPLYTQEQFDVVPM